MSATRDPDRLLRAWLDLMPDEAPDRAITAVLQATERAPQVRRPFGQAFRRDPMNRLPLLTAAAALVVVVAAVALLLRPNSNVGPAATTSQLPATGTPTTSALGAIAAALQGGWLGAHHDLASIAGDAGTHLQIDAGRVSLSVANVQNRPILVASASSDAGGTLHLAGPSAASGDTCETGSEGSYAAALSASGETLTLTKIADDCPARAAGVAGTWWRTDCFSNACIGNVDAGAYGTEYFMPRMRASTDWAPHFGAFSYQTPIPWAEAADLPTNVDLVPPSQYKKWTADGAPDNDPLDILVFTQPGAEPKGGTCSENPVLDPAVGRTVADLLAFVKSGPDVQATPAADIEIDGHVGKVIDLQLSPRYTGSCPGVPAPIEDLLMSTFPKDFAFYALTLEGTERTRLILVDLGGGDVVGIAIEASPANWQPMLNDAMPIIQSFTFK
jgi:hypothetical protein